MLFRSKTALFALLSNTAPVDSPELYYVYGSGNECAYMAAATVDLHDGTAPRRFRYCGGRYSDIVFSFVCPAKLGWLDE